MNNYIISKIKSSAKQFANKFYQSRVLVQVTTHTGFQNECSV